jgi:hypothetical protein
LICFSLLPAGVLHSEIQTQHALDTSLKIGRFESLWHLRARTKPEGGGLFQIRTGPILEFDLNERVTLIAGHYFTRDQGEGRWRTINRPFGGAELIAYDGAAVDVEYRSLLERFIIPGEPDYFRFRNRLRLSPHGVTAPYVAVEVFVDAQGARSTRYGAGVRHVIDREFIVDVGYFFENRRSMPAGERHMFSTSFHWRNKTRHIAPDF